MEQKINIAELLKDCPKGTELYSPLVGDCKFVKVHDYESQIIVKLETGATVAFLSDGRYFDYSNAECMLFPSKEKTTWEDFQRPFMDGDMVATTNGLWIGITTGGKIGKFIPTYCVIQCDDKFEAYLDRKESWVFNRLATEEEKAKLFQAIKDNGYYWNTETKTLENLVEPWTIQYAKDGDVLAFDDETIVIFKDLYNNTSFHSYCHIEDGIFTISKEDMPGWWRAEGFYPATEEQCTLLFRKIKEAGYHWNPETKTLEKLLKFKVGDKIKYKNGKNIDGVEQGVILSITDEVYDVAVTNNMGVFVSIAEQDDWELVPNKFDITTLKSFDKVLVRSANSDIWECDFFSSYNPKCSNRFHCIGAWYNICIPYIGNEHLLGTTDDCDEYFKNWEE